ncbi:BgTH12-04624, partial [Blumeria graminis f. sp. triticale]
PYKPDETSENQHHLSLHALTLRTTSAGQTKGGISPRQICVFLKSRNSPTTIHNWQDVHGLGELTSLSAGPWVDKSIRLSVYIREIFSAQPLRQFAHGFLMFGTQLQLWVYDRSGPYSADIIEVGENPERLVYVIAAYMLMSDKEHGLDSIIQREKGRISVNIYDADTKIAKKIYFRSKPLIKQMAIVSRGTTVYISSDAKFVVKISWRAVGRLSEVQLLMRARNVRGVATWIGSRDYVKISDLRSGLTFAEEMNRDIHPLEMKMTTAGNSLQSGSSNAGESDELSRGVKSKRSCVLSVSRQALHNAATAQVRKNAKSTSSRKKPVTKTDPNPTTINANPVAQDVTQDVSQDVPLETPSVSMSSPAESSCSLAEVSNSSLGKRPRDADNTDAKAQMESEPDLKKLRISSNVGQPLSEAVVEPVSNQVMDDPSPPNEQAVKMRRRPPKSVMGM